MDIDNIIFYNFWHNGDIHVSRSFVRYIVENVPAKNYFYCHLNSPKLIQDISKLKHKPFDLPEEFRWKGWYLDDKTLYCNTWYNAYEQQEFKGCTIQTLFNIFRRGLKETINFDLPGEPIDYLPEIDGFCYTHEPITEFLNKIDYERSVLISNCDVLSGQSHNFDFNPIINYFSDIYPSISFIVTNMNGDKINRKNVYYFQDVIKVNGCDLNEIALLSNFIPIIIGRNSGPQTFTFLKRNVMSNKIFICFSHEAFGILGENIKAKMVCSQNYAIGSVTAVIEKEIRGRFQL